jgi:hypothetical protein
MYENCMLPPCFVSVITIRTVTSIFDLIIFEHQDCCRGRHGHDRMVVGFTTTCAISAYHH